MVMFEDLMKFSRRALSEDGIPPARSDTGSMADHTPTTATPPGRVLIVDDEQPLAQMVASSLIRAGFDTRQAHTGTQDVAEARRVSPARVVVGRGWNI